MNRNPILHYLPQNQTTPDIYAATTQITAGQYSGESCFFEWTLTLTLGGRVRMQSASGKEFDQGPGDAVLTRPRVWHEWRPIRQAAHTDGPPDADWRVSYVVFNARPHWIPWLDAMRYDDGIATWHFDGRARVEIEHAMQFVTATYHKSGVMRDDRTMAALEMLLITLSERTEHMRFVTDKRIREAVETINDHFAQPISVADLAAASHLSTPHFSALFTSAVGLAPGQYIERIRLDRAAEKLRFGSDSIGDIARATGYAEPKYFAHRFRLRYGQTPREFRRARRVGGASSST